MFFFFHRACLIATVRSSGASQSTIKLVATNLIASGKLAGILLYDMLILYTACRHFLVRNYKKIINLEKILKREEFILILFYCLFLYLLRMSTLQHEFDFLSPLLIYIVFQMLQRA